MSLKAKATIGAASTGAAGGLVFGALGGWATGSVGDALLASAVLVPIGAAFLAVCAWVGGSILDGSAAE